jgi:cytochrome c peroxidase
MLSHFYQLLRQIEPLSRCAQIVGQRSVATLVFICSAVLLATIGYTLSAQQPTTPQSGKPAGPPVYNPYPPGILPPDLDAEISRVRSEVRTIFNRYLAQAQALPPTTYSNTQGVGNPPTIQGSGYEGVRILGGLLNYDQNMSPLRNVACASCHMPYAGFSGPIPSVNLTIVAYPGTFHFRAGKRTAQRYTYAPQFPVLHFNATLQAFVGGAFWDARATGYRLQSPDAEQAQHPPVDTQEMGFPDIACIAWRISQAQYRSLFEQVWGSDFEINWPADTEQTCSTPGGNFPTATPIALSPNDRTKANDIYNHWGQSISALEHTDDVSPFSSKFDAFLAGKATLTSDEMAGYKLFDGKAACNTCHLDGRGSTQTSGTGSDSKPSTTTGIDTSAATNQAPLFSCLGYANEGLPLNPRLALFYQNKPDALGFTPNPLGFGYRDLGLGNFLRSGPGSAPNPNATWISRAPTSDGQMQTSTARDVAMTPKQCPTTEAPGPYFQKEFFHNGYIKSLKQLVHFYNTRDVYAYNVTSGHCPAGTTEKVDCWPMPEVPNNIDMTTGNLGLTDQEEDQIVAFLQTLTDGFTTPYPNSDTYTGVCKTGGSASTQGNELLIPTPDPLPSCASAICGVAPLPSPHKIP